MRIAAILLTMSLAACATKADAPPERVRTVEVQVPVRQPCVPGTFGPAPDYPDTDSALRKAADAAERYLLLFAGRKLRVARESELNAVVAGCR